MTEGAEPGVGTTRARTLRTLELADFLLIAECVLAIPAKRVAEGSNLLSSCSGQKAGPETACVLAPWGT
jgi:hypothetical protein